ncbi:MAG: hypothetical protein KUG64_11030 [Cycloclasticus sp.]|nr:hypothetical protein [Cycloclasticus sp.]
MEEPKIEKLGEDYEDIDEIIKLGCDVKYTMKEIINFDDEKFNRFYQRMLQSFNENLGHDTTQALVIVVLQVVINKRENRRLERKLDLLSNR